jgi:hypothetical protein
MTNHQDAADTRATNGAVGPELSPFARSLIALRDRSKSVPAGWRPKYDKAVHKLHGMDCEQRADLCVTGPWVAHGTITLSVSRADRCVEGLIRRTAAQLQARCELCGRPGRMRVFGIKARVLCAECYAPRGLERDVNQLLDHGGARSESHSILFEADIPDRVRAFVQPSAWREHRDARGYVVRYLLREDTRDWQDLVLGITERSGRAAM